MHELELEDIDGVYEDLDGAPIARISSLVDGGLYFARPTEVCGPMFQESTIVHLCYHLHHSKAQSIIHSKYEGASSTKIPHDVGVGRALLHTFRCRGPFEYRYARDHM